MGLADLDSALSGGRSASGMTALDADLARASSPAMAAPGDDKSAGRILLDSVKRGAGETAHQVKAVLGIDEQRSPMDFAMTSLALAHPISWAGRVVEGLNLGKYAAPAARSLTSGALEAGRAWLGGRNDPLTAAALGTIGPAALEGAASAGSAAAQRAAAKPLADEAKATAARTASMVDRGAAEIAKAGRQAEADRVAQEIGAVLPELKVGTARELYDLAKTWGRKKIEDTFSTATGALTAKMNVPNVGTVKIKVPALGETSMTAEDAIARLVNAEDDVKRAARPQLIAAMNALDPKAALGDALETALKRRAQGYAYVTAIEKSLDKSGQLDVSKLAAFVNKARMPDAVRNVFTAGKPLPLEVPPKPTTPTLAAEPEKAGAFARTASKVAGTLDSNEFRSLADAAIGQPETAATTATVAPGVFRYLPGARMLPH